MVLVLNRMGVQPLEDIAQTIFMFSYNTTAPQQQTWRDEKKKHWLVTKMKHVDVST